jgi:hypothetical protein
MQQRAENLRKYSVETPREMIMENNDEDLWNISSEIRRQVFCVECGIDETDEFDSNDPISRPLIGYSRYISIVILEYLTTILGSGRSAHICGQMVVPFQ